VRVWNGQPGEVKGFLDFDFRGNAVMCKVILFVSYFGSFMTDFDWRLQVARIMNLGA
jgi:hypothetical protein